jgi:hypothetical protein
MRMSSHDCDIRELADMFVLQSRDQRNFDIYNVLLILYV